MTIAVVGLGYVGLPLALQFCRSGVETYGIDIDPRKVEQLLRGESYIRHIPTTAIRSTMDNGLLHPTTDFARISEAEAVIIRYAMRTKAFIPVLKAACAIARYRQASCDVST